LKETKLSPSSNRAQSRCSTICFSISSTFMNKD
jgi:hypothetical protein